MVPFRLELRGILVMHLLFWEVTIVDVLIWRWSVKSETKTVKESENFQQDRSPPLFEGGIVPYAGLCAPIQGKRSLLPSLQKRVVFGGFLCGSSVSSGRRSARADHCFVEQVKGRDYTEPAFQLGFHMEDERSEVKSTLCVGTYRGGCDAIGNEPIGGPWSPLSKKLPAGIPLYFTVTGTNARGLSSSVSCQIDTYDITPPVARITPAFYSTSNPRYLRASAIVQDDSSIDIVRGGVGYGGDVYGDQVVSWYDVSLDNTGPPVTTAIPLDNFVEGKKGRLNSKPHQTDRFVIPEDCARLCLTFPITKCLSFNYDYGSAGTCEILEELEVPGVQLHQNGHFHHFERRGVGKMLQFDYDNLSLTHDNIYYFNVYLQNSLGYTSILSSKAVMADHTPPSPGLISNKRWDQVYEEVCEDYIPDEWEHKCIQQTTLPNHRAIVDGEGSRTVFNGHQPLEDMLYTRANTYVSANWDGFHDNETGIFGYTWTVGTTPCQEDIHPHKDPHSHLFDESEWTHTGIADGLDLPDGIYHVTVRAINKVEFGGPMATTVCHSTPYTIDNTQPFVHSVTNVNYDDETHQISAEYNVSDPLSKIREVDLGLGRSKRDVYLMDWHRHDNTTHITHNYQIPDGVPAWVKIRAINNGKPIPTPLYLYGGYPSAEVDLRKSGYADSPILVDTSPPTAGSVFDGPTAGHDIDFQNDQSEICANWRDFHDEESGIDYYLWGVGTIPDADDIASFEVISHSSFSSCKQLSTPLLHNITYYSTLIALNGGHKHLNTSVSSDGVLVDTTPPTTGWIIDGLNKGNDMQFSSEQSTVSANWGDFSDPESGIASYSVSVSRRHASKGDVTSDWEVIHPSEEVNSNTDHINWHHFHLHHGDTVAVQLKASNQAGSDVTVESDGFVVDTTPPVLHFLGDGAVAGMNRKFSSTLSFLSANWDFEDKESDLDHFKISVFETHGGRKHYLNLGDSQEQIIPGSRVNWTSPELTLRPGRHYSIRVTAVNRAGLSSVHDTDGVVMDTTPPSMVKVRVGVLASDVEEVVDGFVWQTDRKGILANWLASDGQSGIEAYWIAVGSYPGGSDVSELRSMGPAIDGYIGGIELPLTDLTTNTPVYYVTVLAENGAGLQSQNMTSRPIKVVPGDRAGVVFDGPLTVANETHTNPVDVDFQLDNTAVTVQFEGFRSVLNGLAHIEWAIGTSPRLDDVQPFSAAGIVLAQDSQHPGYGLHGAGQAQALVPLQAGTTYYATVRGITGSGDVLETSSDGITVDRSAPVTQIVDIGCDVSNESVGSVENCYQTNSDYLDGEWETTDNESAVAYSAFFYGTAPGLSDVTQLTSGTEENSVPSTLVVPVADGRPNFLNVLATNKVGLKSVTTSNGIIVDDTPPDGGIVTCSQYVQPRVPISCAWAGFHDKESDISHYVFGLGTDEGDDSVYNFTPVSTHLSSTDGLLKGITLEHGGTYYATLTAVNGVGLKAQAFSEPITVDMTPPVPGLVIELTGVDMIELQSRDNLTDLAVCNSREDCEKHNAVCQKSLTSVYAAWEDFLDPESPVIRYEVAVGTAPGLSDLSPFTNVDAGKRSAVVDGLDLTQHPQVFVMVRAHNAAGLVNTATSDGVFVSRISSGLMPLRQPMVYDGETMGEDMDYQERTDQLAAIWDFSGDPCPVVKYEWSIVRVDEHVLQPLTAVPEGQTYGKNDEVDLMDKQTYYSIVRATNALGYSYFVRSDGITITREPLLPGHVRDGGIFGVDLNGQPSITTISANWDRFGGPAMEIQYYEIAVGSDRRFPSTRSNIHPFTNNRGVNRTATFIDLLLVPGGVYYVTVRATGVSTAITDVTSNGLTVGVGGEPPQPQSIDIPRFISSVEAITFAWDDFLTETPMLFYQLGMTSRAFTEMQHRPCKEMQQFQESAAVSVPEDIRHLFDIHPLTTVGKDTMIEQDGLSLENGKTYTVVIVGTNEASECVTVLHEVSVDTTPPTGGTIVVGERDLETVHFVTSPDVLHIAWEGFHDEDSGVKSVEVTLYEGMTCSDSAGTLVALTDSINVPLNSSDYLFREISLQVDVPYYVQLKVTNNAELSALFTSSPILLDSTDPITGVVVDGKDFKRDRSHQNYTDKMEGVFLHLPVPYGDSCPRRRYDFGTESDDWSAVLTSGMWKAGRPDTILFLPDQISYLEDDGLEVKMQRDIREPRMKSGAVHTKALLQEAGKYQMTIQAAGGDIYAVTSITFWGGPEGVVAGFDTSFDVRYVEETTAADSEECDCCFNNTFAPETGMYNVSSNDAVEICNCSCATVVSTESADNTGLTTTYEPASDVFWEFEREPVPGDTYDGSEEDWGKDHPSFGLQLQKGLAADGTEKHYAVMWLQPAIAGHEPQQELLDLNFDPSEAFHMYALDFQVDRTDPKNEVWSVDLIIDGTGAMALSGLPPLPTDAVVTFSVWNFEDFVPDVDDPFYPPTATAHFKDVSFPASSDQLCRYGEPFRDGDSAILSFMAGVGAEAHRDDVVPFRKVPYHSCIPCLRDCDNFYCSNDCDGSGVTEHHVLLDNLVLDVNSTVEDGVDNVTVPAKYYMIIKATTASGRQVLASSDGVYIDVTPPRFESLFHVDTSWSMDEPTEFQGSNSSIAVRWRAIDMESKITEYRWAIGTSKGSTDIRDFDTIIPTDEKDVLAVAEDLDGLLEDGSVYYVTVVALNLAGLEQTVHTNGVTVLMTEPNTTSANISVPGAVQIAPSVVFTEDQTSLSFTWTAVEDSGIDAYYFSVGSTQRTPDDIVPRTQVGVNGSGFISIHDGIVEFEGFIGDLSEMRERTINDANKTFPNNFLMEPGRNLFVHMDACNSGHKCGRIQSPIVVIRRDADTIGTSTNGEDIAFEVQPSDGGNSTVFVKTTRGLHPGEKIVYSQLSKQDVVQEYTSDASARFKPIVVNPYQTADLTDRNLRHRIRSYTDHMFVLSPVAGHELRGPLNITVTTGNLTAAPSELPRLLFWNTDSEMWQDAGRTCQSSAETYTYKNTEEFSVLVCNTSNVPVKPNSVRREKRSQQGSAFFGRETFFVVALVDTSFQNSAPRLVVPPYLWTYEDRSIVAYLEAVDDDDDDVTFSVDRSTEALFTGEVEIDPSGKLYYRPCKDCFGQDLVTVIVSENRNDGETPLVTRETLYIDVLALEDSPDVFAVKDEAKVNSTGDSITVTLEENTAQIVDQSEYDVLVFGADIDTYDVLSLVFHDPSNGTLVLSKMLRNITFLHNDTDDRTTVVDGATFVNESAEEVSIPYPQNLLMPHQPEQYSWVAVGFTYIPDMNYYGHDQVRVYAHDQSGKRSDVLTFDFFVRENRCMNGGLCTGPSHDPNCTDIHRSVSFSGYECACPDGYYGKYCESNFDECSSNPCPQNYTCVDLPNDFLCDCGSPAWPCASQSMPPWQIALIALLCLGVTIAVVTWAACKASKGVKNKIEPHRITEEDIELTNMHTERPSELAVLKQNPWVRPELPTEAPEAPQFPLKALKETRAHKTE